MKWFVISINTLAEGNAKEATRHIQTQTQPHISLTLMEGDMSHWLNELSQVVHAMVYTHKHTGKDVIIYSN